MREVLNGRRPALALLAALAALPGVGPAWAEHEPRAYSYAGARSRSHAVEFKPSTNPRPLAREALGSDPVITRKMDSLIDGFTSAGLAGVAVKDGQVVYEKYRQADDRNLYPARSMTKSLVALAVGHALCEGHIKSLDDLAQRYVPDIEGTVWGRASVRQLLQMRSGTPRQGLGRGGDYLFSGTSSGLEMVRGRLAMTEVLRRFSGAGDPAPAGTRYAYSNMDTDTLGLVVAGATGKPFTAYFEATVLAGARLEHPSLFHLDRAGNAVTHGYFFATLRDFARLGLYTVDLYQGREGNACLKDYMAEAVTPYTRTTNSLNRSPIGYGYQFWLDPGFGRTETESVRMSGHQGQDLFMNLRTGKVVVVLGWSASVRDKSQQPDSVVDWLVR